MIMDIEDVVNDIIDIVQEIVPESQAKYKESLLRRELEKLLKPLFAESYDDF